MFRCNYMLYINTYCNIRYWSHQEYPCISPLLYPATEATASKSRARCRHSTRPLRTAECHRTSPLPATPRSSEGKWCCTQTRSSRRRGLRSATVATSGGNRSWNGRAWIWRIMQSTTMLVGHPRYYCVLGNFHPHFIFAQANLNLG